MRPVLALAALALVGCDGATLPGAPVGDLVVTELEDGIRIETENVYPCANYALAVETAYERDRVTVEVEGVEDVGVCLTALGPARVTVDYPASASDGANPSYDLVLRKGGRTDHYRALCGLAGCSFGPVGRPTFSRVGPR